MEVCVRESDHEKERQREKEEDGKRKRVKEKDWSSQKIAFDPIKIFFENKYQVYIKNNQRERERQTETEWDIERE